MFFGTFSLFTYISRNWFLHCLILSFRAVLNQSVQFRFRLSLSFSLCVCLSQQRSFSLSSIHSYHPNVLVPKRYLHLEWTLPKEMQINGLVEVIITRLRWTYADQSVKICYRSKYSGLVSPFSQNPENAKCELIQSHTVFQDSMKFFATMPWKTLTLRWKTPWPTCSWFTHYQEQLKNFQFSKTVLFLNLFSRFNYLFFSFCWLNWIYRTHTWFWHEISWVLI